MQVTVKIISVETSSDQGKGDKREERRSEFKYNIFDTL
jgi:hypothetical protein